MCARSKRPRCRADKRGFELSASGVDCHATLRWGHANGGDDITPNRAAPRDFKPAYVGLGSGAGIRRGHADAYPLMSAFKWEARLVPIPDLSSAN